MSRSGRATESGPGRRRRRFGPLAVVAVALLALTACAPEPDRDWVPPVRAAATGFDEDAGAAPGTEPGAVALDHLRAYDSAPAIDARWTEVPGQQALNERVRSLVVDAMTAFAGRQGLTYVPEAAPAGAATEQRGCATGSSSTPALDLLAASGLAGEALVITCEVLIASGTEFGERIRIVEGAVTAREGEALTVVEPVVTRDESFVLFADTGTGELQGGADVISADAAQRIWSELVLAARRELGALWDTEVGAPSDANAAVLAQGFADVAPLPDGGLRVGIPQGLTTPEMDVSGAAAVPVAGAPAEGLVVGQPIANRFPSIRLSAEAAAPMLTQLGTELVAASAAPQPLVVGQRPPAGVRDVDCALFACVALTFDDGPAPGTTTVLETLREKHAAATFFVVGPNVERHPGIVKQMVDEGHQVGNHSWTHPHFTTLDDKKIEEEVKRTSDAIAKATGKRPDVFRPPYGDVDARVLAKLGLPSILWDVDTLDWQGPPHETLVDRGADEAQAGSIILMHDVHDSTVAAVPEIVDGLQRRGLVLVTLEQLFEGAPPAGSSYTSART